MGIPIVWFELDPGDARSLLARPELMGDLIDIAVEVADAHAGHEDGERVPDSPTDAVLRAAVRSARQGSWKSMMRLAELNPDPGYADRFARFIEGDISVVPPSLGTRAIARYSRAHLLAALDFLHGGELREFLSLAASRHGWVFIGYT